MSKQYYVYIMTNKRNTVLYTGVTNELRKRVYEHKEKLVDGFTKKYNIIKLVYYEIFQDPENAIMREKHLKAGSRQKKIDLINQLNKEWRDLYEQLWGIATPSARNDKKERLAMTTFRHCEALRGTKQTAEAISSIICRMGTGAWQANT